MENDVQKRYFLIKLTPSATENLVLLHTAVLTFGFRMIV